MKRDIRINYGKIEDIISELIKYEDSLTIMKDTIDNIKENIENSKSEAIDALLDNFTTIDDDINMCKEEIVGVKNILTNYINDMETYSDAIDRGQLMQVDSNDIYWNIDSIKGCRNKISSAIARGELYFGSNSNEYTDISKENYNANQISQLNKQATIIMECLDKCIQEIWDIYNRKVIPFEETDDDYKSKAWDLYWSYTGLGDWIGDFFSFLTESVADIVKGVLDAIVDMIKGILQLGVGIIKYLGSGMVVLVTSPFGTTPDWAKEYFDNTNNMISSIINDPMLLVEGIAQGASDAVDTKGIFYCGGYILGDVLGAKGLNKLTKITKGLITGQKSTNIHLFDDTGKFIDEVLESNYQKYVQRQAKSGKPIRDRLDWKKASDFYTKESPIARGNKFNETARKADIYEYHEVHLSNGKRLDSYDPDLGEIISRKATDLDKISEDTFRKYLSEFDEKYSRGTEIRSNKYKELDGTKLKGQYILEIPASNANIDNIKHFESIAEEYGVKLRFLEEMK